MFQFYPLIFILQGFCLYHAYKNRADQKWFWFIIILPLIGCVFYLYDHFYSKDKVESLAEGVKGIVNKNYEIEKLEKKLKLTDSQLNKTNLADKYMEIGQYTQAIALYKSCLSQTDSNSTELLKCLAYAHYQKDEYADCVTYSEQINDPKEFNKSREKIGYAWSLYQIGEKDKAETTFKEMDSRFTNYPQRLAYGQFLYLNDRKEEAKKHLEALLTEFEQMQPNERKHNRGILSSIHSKLKSFQD